MNNGGQTSAGCVVTNGMSARLGGRSELALLGIFDAGVAAG